jgi:hypothetical protein
MVHNATTKQGWYTWAYFKKVIEQWDQSSIDSKEYSFAKLGKGMIGVFGCSSFYGGRYHCGKVSGNGGSCVWQWHRRTMYHCGSASLWVMEWCGVAFDGGSMALIGVPTTRRCTTIAGRGDQSNTHQWWRTWEQQQHLLTTSTTHSAFGNHSTTVNTTHMATTSTTHQQQFLANNNDPESLVVSNMMHNVCM